MADSETDEPDLTSFGPTLSPPNGGNVSRGDLYKALYELDLGLSRRFTAFLEVMTGMQGIATETQRLASQLRTDFEAHRNDGHPKVQHEETVRAEIGLDAKKLAIVGAFITMLTASTVLITALVSRA